MSEGPTIGDWTQYGWIPDGASSFPARVRLRNAAWMVYYEPDVTDLEAEVPLLRRENKELLAENAKLRELLAEIYPYAKAYLQEWLVFGGIDSKSYDWYLRLRELGIEMTA